MNRKSAPVQDDWLYEISAKRKLIDLNFKEIWRYRDLLVLFVHRDLVTIYKQTVLGPLWFLIQPLFTSTIFTLVFNNLGSINTGTVPPFLFNLAGITVWNYFKSCFNSAQSTFRTNAGLFGKVYFPRAIVPMSKLLSNLVRFSIQMLIFSIFYLFYVSKGAEISPNQNLWLFPLYIVLTALFGMGFGMIIGSMTTKYRDLGIIFGFFMNLLMYLSAVPYPLIEAQNKLPQSALVFVEYNPITHLVEGFRYMLLNTGEFSVSGFLYLSLVTLVIFFLGLIIFNRTEKTFIDTV